MNLVIVLVLYQKLVEKSEGINDKRIDKSVTRFNYRLTLFTFTSLHWIYEGFYHKVNGITVKRVPEWIGEYITPLGLAHLIMQAGSIQEKGRLFINTQFNHIEDIEKIINILKTKFNIDSTIHCIEEKLVISISAHSMPVLRSIVKIHMDPTMLYLLNDNVTDIANTIKLSDDKVVPIATYINADTQKESVIVENKGKSGIYRWINKENGSSYVGSSVNLSKRLTNYYSYSYISDPKRNMLIHKAILKYGYSAFLIQILEYCEPSDAIKREQYNIDLLKPEYNIFKTAGSSLGHKHSEEA